MATAAAAGGSSLLSLGLGAMSAINKGKGTQAADDFKADQLDRSSTYGKLKAEQTDAAMTERLNATLGNIDAIRSAAGTDPNSPTGQAITTRTTFLGDRNRTTAVNSILTQAAQDEADANYMRKAGDYALKTSYLDAATGVAGGLYKGFANKTLSLGAA